METKEYRGVWDKSEWDRGPWDDEPDKLQWQDEATGLPCLIVRGPVGALCGYVGVMPGHGFYQTDYNDCPICCGSAENWCEHSPRSRLNVHGGLTFSGDCAPATPEVWGKLRASKYRQEAKAKKYPHGDSAQWMKKWATAFDNYEEFRRIMEESSICHADPENPNVWWFGFDCAHCDDFAPAMTKHRLHTKIKGEEYRDVAYVRAQCAELAKQLKEIACTPAGPVVSSLGAGGASA